jgi:predicted amidohydrolase YtcJ
VTTHTNRYLYKQSEPLAEQLRHEDELVPLRSLLDAGVPLSFGTDNVPTSLWHPIWHAVARKGMRSGRVVAPAQRLTRLEALRVATAGGAALVGDGARGGRLLPGRYADLAMLDADPFAVDEDALPAIRSVLTITGGRVAHDALR